MLSTGAWLDEARAVVPYDIQLCQLNLLDSHDTCRFVSRVKGNMQIIKVRVKANIKM